MLCPGGVQTCAQQTAVEGAKEAVANQDQDKQRWLVIDHLIILVLSWMVWNFLQSGHIRTVASVASALPFLASLSKV